MLYVSRRCVRVYICWTPKKDIGSHGTPVLDGRELQCGAENPAPLGNSLVQVPEVIIYNSFFEVISVVWLKEMVT